MSVGALIPAHCVFGFFSANHRVNSMRFYLMHVLIANLRTRCSCGFRVMVVVEEERPSPKDREPLFGHPASWSVGCASTRHQRTFFTPQPTMVTPCCEPLLSSFVSAVLANHVGYRQPTGHYGIQFIEDPTDNSLPGLEAERQPHRGCC